MPAEKTTGEIIKDWLIRTRGYYTKGRSTKDKVIFWVIVAFCVGAFIYGVSQ